jgi:hypothetical protein
LGLFSSSNILYPADPLRALVCLWPANKKQNTFLLSFYPSIPFFLFSDSYLISYRLGLCFSENPRKEKEEEKIRDFGWQIATKNSVRFEMVFPQHPFDSGKTCHSSGASCPVSRCERRRACGGTSVVTIDIYTSLCVLSCRNELRGKNKGHFHKPTKRGTLRRDPQLVLKRG